jgi:hypothetical protein
MRPTVRTAFLLLLVPAGLIAGCGGGSNGDKSGSTAAPKRGFSAEPIERGYYAGITCSDSHCATFATFRSVAKLYCSSGGHLGHPVSYPPYPAGYTRWPSFVCFRLVPANATQRSATPNLVKNFYIRTQQVLGQGHVASDSFGTSDNGWDVSGEWMGPEDVDGHYRNPSGATGYYAASWYSS